MRPTTPSGLLILVLAFVLPGAAGAQSAPPVIHRVTLQPETGVLTIVGTGLGAELLVTLEGQAISVLPGATATQIDALGPPPMLATPGTYRLTLVDPVRRAGDGFVVAIAPGGGLLTSGAPVDAAAGAATSATRPEEVRGAPGVDRVERAPDNSGVSPKLVEGGTNTAVGDHALFLNTTGFGNTAIGADALLWNTTGNSNTALGWEALARNTHGVSNTASGVNALYWNTTGSFNTATGPQALVNNRTGNHNTATGLNALYSNTTGGDNTANGAGALYSNTTGTDNTASGRDALVSNTGGFFNTASGSDALFSNTTGAVNTASGVSALYSNLTGDSNTAIGTGALFWNTTGANNTAVGYNAGRDATGSFNVFLGAYVPGTGADTHTMRLGLPYDGAAGTGQNRTFIAGVAGTVLTTPAVQVFVDANGQLGTLVPAPFSGTIDAPVNGSPRPDAAAPDRRVEEAAVRIAALEDVVRKLEAAVAELQRGKARPSGDAGRR